MTDADRDRIAKEANEWVDYNSGGAFHLVPSQSESYIAGATCENERIAELLKEERKKAYDAIGKAYAELKKMGYGGDMNILAVMIKLQEQFK